MRIAKGLSQESLAYAAKCDDTTISRIERGRLDCSPETLAAIKAFLEVENAPLFDHELAEYKHYLATWRELINANRLTEAKAMYNKLSVIIYMPFELDLFLQFSVLETMLLLLEGGDVSAAEEKLNTVEVLLDNASDDVLSLFYTVKGYINCNCHYGDSINGLRHFVKALNLKEPDARLLLYIGIAYRDLGKPYMAIKYLELAQAKYGDSYTSSIGPSVACVHATCYVLVGEYSNAKALLDQALIMARSIGDEYYMKVVPSDMAWLHIKTGNYKASIELSNQVLAYGRPENGGIYDVALFNKGLALSKMKDFSQLREVVEHGLSISKGNEMFTISFTALGHLMTLDDKNSVSYIENTAIPYFKSAPRLKHLAFDMCAELEQHHKTKRSNTKALKALAIGAVMRDIYEEMFLEDVDLGEL